MPSTVARAACTPRGELLVEAGVVLGALCYLLWPTFGSGDLLGRDLVFVAYQPLDWQTLGIGGASPRAVPLDLVVGLVQPVLGSWLTGRLALVAVLAGAMLGVRRLLVGVPLPGRVAAMALSVINPYVVERLAMGHWALLAAYAALPWLLVAGRRLAGFVLAVAAASLTPTGGLIAVVTVLMLVGAGQWRGRRAILRVALVLLAQLPWVVAALAGGSTLRSDPTAVTAFAARAERPGGALPTLLSTAGIWNAETAVPSQSGWRGWLILLIAVAVLVAGRRLLAERLGRRYAVLLVLSCVGLLLAAASAWAPGAAALEALIEHVPGAGLLRDAHKWIAPYALLVALGAGAAAADLGRATRGAGRVGAVLAAAAVPLVLLPDAGRVLAPTLRPVHYGPEWAQAAALVDASDVTVVLPWRSYRNYEWAGARPSIDPAGRALPGLVVGDDGLVVAGERIAGESALAADVGRALEAADVAAALRRLGVSQVLIEHATDGEDVPIEGEVVLDTAKLTLLRIGAGTWAGGGTAGVLTAVAHGVYLLLAVAGIGLLVARLVVRPRLVVQRCRNTTGE